MDDHVLKLEECQTDTYNSTKQTEASTRKKSPQKIIIVGSNPYGTDLMTNAVGGFVGINGLIHIRWSRKALLVTTRRWHQLTIPIAISLSFPSTFKSSVPIQSWIQALTNGREKLHLSFLILERQRWNIGLIIQNFSFCIQWRWKHLANDVQKQIIARRATLPPFRT